MALEAQKESGSDGQSSGQTNESPEAGGKPESGRREFSTIAFPYVNLQAVEAGTKAIFDNAGMSEITLAQAAVAMGTTVTSSGFRGDIGAMKLFGLIETGQGRVRLTGLGRAISEQDSVASARVAAFESIPLYAKVIERHGGKSIPKASALEAEFVEHGVNKKQVERARQVFERSARHAGFLRPGSDRFCATIVTARADARTGNEKQVTEQEDTEPPYWDDRRKQGGGAGGHRGGGRTLHPFIEGLLETLPEPGADWTMADRAKWLQTAASIFGLIYKGDGEVTVSLKNPV